MMTKRTQEYDKLAQRLYDLQKNGRKGRKFPHFAQMKMLDKDYWRARAQVVMEEQAKWAAALVRPRLRVVA